jgi:predicted transposase YdaD
MAMGKPLDATMHELYELEPAAWLEFLGVAVPDPGLAAVIEANLSTVTAESDKLIRLGGPAPLILHTEFLSGRVVSYPRQLHRYNALAAYKYETPVWSVLFLLRPAADGPELTGEHVQEVPGRGVNLWFRYDVVRIWQVPVERLLTAGLSLLPLAPVSDVPWERLAEVLRAVARRLRDEAPSGLRETLWTATEILLGLNHPKELVKALTQEITTMVLGIHGIEDSSVYQDIFAKGRAEGEARGRAEGEVEEARKTLLRLGPKRLGPLDQSLEGRIAAIGDLDRLDSLIDRLLEVATWEELLAAPES